MSTPPDTLFCRSLPLFDNADRDTIQRLLHHAVEDLSYDHPDRKIARDLYHEIREGEAIRLKIGPAVRDETFVLLPRTVETDAETVLRRFVKETESGSEEWRDIAEGLRGVKEDVEEHDDVRIAFEYLH
ncbi:hypothetical protein EXE46_12175 [Halorubrum sp. GN11_10-6_MGM]|uniref:hypothetical protein n=1 Tax=Halorubrum sp. GN11_10-6_MGM TaxID=2518112 RepID=UPI0010F516D4|nr:hypothetical protein [Halorubrum sp. GN11_10-6_MGM]TKX73848.1 hypothetical protein EXE46_12175 [Halorubrum sp. GN11_10-6_MGM]